MPVCGHRPGHRPGHLCLGFVPIRAPNRRFPAGFLKLFQALLAQPSLPRSTPVGPAWPLDHRPYALLLFRNLAHRNVLNVKYTLGSILCLDEGILKGGLLGHSVSVIVGSFFGPFVFTRGISTHRGAHLVFRSGLVWWGFGFLSRLVLFGGLSCFCLVYWVFLWVPFCL